MEVTMANPGYRRATGRLRILGMTAPRSPPPLGLVTRPALTTSFPTYRRHAEDWHTGDRSERLAAVRGAVHRMVDVSVAGALLVLTSPLLAVAAVAVRLRMGRPVLFRDERAGRHGRPFRLVKLRTMRAPSAGDDGPDSDARRLTRLGRWLRATSIDELPSLVNVIRGEMAMVGPRPLPVRYLARYTPEQARRLDVHPGLTGWAQIHGRNATAWDDRLALDLWYVDHRSLALDLRIMAATVGLVLRRQGVSHDGHATMPELPEPGRGAGSRSS
jgi:lipopolysaccharide/colanic/teichoic acid biosynthesis glycosyltransferase